MLFLSRFRTIGFQETRRTESARSCCVTSQLIRMRFGLHWVEERGQRTWFGGGTDEVGGLPAGTSLTGLTLIPQDRPAAVLRTLT